MKKYCFIVLVLIVSGYIYVNKQFEISEGRGIAALSYFGTLLGALVGGSMAFWGTFWAKKKDMKQESVRNEEKKKRLAKSFYVEIQEINEMIKDRLTRFEGLERHWQEGFKSPVEIYISDCYTEIYKVNSGQIGIFQEECSKNLIKTYLSIHALFDTARLMSDFGRRYNEMSSNKAGIQLNNIQKKELEMRWNGYLDGIELVKMSVAIALTNMDAVIPLLEKEFSITDTK